MTVLTFQSRVLQRLLRREVMDIFRLTERPMESRKRRKQQDLTTRYKARVVVKGYFRIPGVHFTASFAPVATDTSIRVVFAITIHKKTWTLEVIDVEASSFCEGYLEEYISLEWPEGVVVEFGF